MSPYRTSAAPLSTRWGATFWARLYARAWWPVLRVLWALGLISVRVVTRRAHERHMARVRRDVDALHSLEGAKAEVLASHTSWQRQMAEALSAGIANARGFGDRPSIDPPRAGNAKVRS